MKAGSKNEHNIPKVGEWRQPKGHPKGKQVPPHPHLENVEQTPEVIFCNCTKCGHMVLPGTAITSTRVQATC